MRGIDTSVKGGSELSDQFCWGLLDDGVGGLGA